MALREIITVPNPLLKKDKHLAKGLNVLKGELTHPAVAEALGKPFADPFMAWA